MVSTTIEIVSNYYKQKLPSKINRGKILKSNLMLYLMLKDINKLSCREIAILVNRSITTIQNLQSKAQIKLITDTLFKKEYLVLTELIKQRNSQYGEAIKLLRRSKN
jgi:hypothetical protein